jgi:hypothetical protein
MAILTTVILACWVVHCFYEQRAKKGGSILLPPLNIFQSWSNKEPFRSRPISANIPAELALLMV